MNLIVSGSRYFDDEKLLFETLDRLTSKFDKKSLFLYVGDNKGKDKSRGTDALAFKWAMSRKIPVKRYTAEWDEYGLRAGPLRNGQMLKEAGQDARLVAFWDGRKEKCGTWDCIQQAMGADLKIKIIRYNEDRKDV